MNKIQTNGLTDKMADLMLNLLSQDLRDIETTTKLIIEYDIDMMEYLAFTKEQALNYDIPITEISLIVSLYEYAIHELYTQTNLDDLLNVGISYYGLDSISLQDVSDNVKALLESRLDCNFAKLIGEAL